MWRFALPVLLIVLAAPACADERASAAAACATPAGQASTCAGRVASLEARVAELEGRLAALETSGAPSPDDDAIDRVTTLAERMMRRFVDMVQEVKREMEGEAL